MTVIEPPTEYQCLSSRLAGSDAKFLAVLFLIYALTVTLALAVIVPPFQNFDEGSHFTRAEQIGRGGIIGHRFGPALSGGFVDPGPMKVKSYFVPWQEGCAGSVTPGMYEQAKTVQWGDQPIQLSFANTAIYQPVLYAPAVLGILVGKSLHLPVLSTLWLARAVSGVVCASVSALAIALSGRIAPFLFASLALPMSVTQLGSVGQDGLIIALSALAVAILVKGLQLRQSPFRKAFTVLCLCLALIAMAKQPYIFLGVFALGARWKSVRARLAGLAFIIAATLAWTGFSYHDAMIKGVPAPADMSMVIAGTTQYSGSDPGGQVRALAEHPGIIGPVIVDGAKRFPRLVSETICEIAWEFTPFPRAFTVVLVLGLLTAFLASARTGGERPLIRRMEAALALAALLATVLGVYGSMYIYHAPVGTREMPGVQGRYFLPVIVLAGVLAVQIKVWNRFERFRPVSLIVIAFLPALSLSLLCVEVLRRYYM